MPVVPLSGFVDFVISSGTTRLTKVQAIKRQIEQGYAPERDFYKGIREGILEFHRGQRSSFDDLAVQSDKKKIAHYAEIINGYKLFLKKEHPSFFNPVDSTWSIGELSVTINPEAGFDLKDGGQAMVKLYFKSLVLSRQRVDLVLHLMKSNLPTRIPPAILDARRGRMYYHKSDSKNLDALLAGEAAAFIEIWRLV